MEIESIYSVHNTNDGDSDDDLQVIGCYSEASAFPPQLAAGRAMTTELADCMSNKLSLPETEQTETESYFTELSEELIEWLVGNPPSTYAQQLPQAHPIAQCSQIYPVPYSPASPPLIDQYPNCGQPDNHDEPLEEHWTHNPHITGSGNSASGICGQPNEIFNSGCVVCGKSSSAIKEEVTRGYLESTHIPGETYDYRLSRRRAFQVRLKAGSFIHVPRGVSQAAACDGVYYQIAPQND